MSRELFLSFSRFHLVNRNCVSKNDGFSPNNCSKHFMLNEIVVRRQIEPAVYATRRMHSFVELRPTAQKIFQRAHLLLLRFSAVLQIPEHVEYFGAVEYVALLQNPEDVVPERPHWKKRLNAPFNL